MPNRRPKCLIGDPAERDMPHQRPIGDRHSSLETHEKRVHKNINIIGYLWETHRRPIRDPSETHRRPKCLIGDKSTTDMPDQRPVGRRPTCLIRDLLETDMPHCRPTCLIGDPLETDMPDRRPTCLIGEPSETFWRRLCLIRDRHA